MDTYPEVVMKTHFVMGNTSGNHTTLGFGHDSLNSVNSLKAI